MERGVFLVGIVWGEFHFSGDFHRNMTVGTVIVVIVRRFSITLVLS
jgi:hypothetical protein